MSYSFSVFKVYVFYKASKVFKPSNECIYSNQPIRIVKQNAKHETMQTAHNCWLIFSSPTHTGNIITRNLIKGFDKELFTETREINTENYIRGPDFIVKHAVSMYLFIFVFVAI